MSAIAGGRGGGNAHVRARFLEELRALVDRPLFLELSLRRGHLDLFSPDDTTLPSWKPILRDIGAFVTSFSEAELLELLDICVLLLLGFLLPYSTGNDFHLLGYSRSRPQSDEDIPEFVSRISLEDRMEASLRVFCVHNTPTSSITSRVADPDWAFAFTEFIEELGKILMQRPLPYEAVDLIHVIAMAINPIPPNNVALPARVAKHPAAERSRILMSHLLAPQLLLLDSHRQSLLKLVSDRLVLPTLRDEFQPGSAPLLYGAWPHLLQAVLAADTQIEVDISRLAVQVGNVELALKPVWDFFMNELIDSNDTPCFSCSRQDHRKDGCAFMRRAKRLSTCIGSKVPEPFRLYASQSVSEAIEWQYECNLDNEENKGEVYPPCLLAALLHASIPSDINKSVVSKATHLLTHSDPAIVREAAKVLSAAMLDQKNAELIGAELVSSLRQCVWKEKCGNLVAISASRSTDIASRLVELVVGPEHMATSEWLVGLCSNAPVEAMKAAKRLRAMMESPVNANFRIAEALLAMRLASFFPTKDYIENQKLVMTTMLGTGSLWDHYRLARHSMTCGCFDFSSLLFQQIRLKMQNEKSYVWLSLLQKTSAAEASLGKDGVLGIPTAVKSLIAAETCSLNLIFGDSNQWENALSFHMKLIALRLDYLRLISVLRHIAIETKLTGVPPKKNTRSFLHLLNLGRALRALSRRYDDLSRCYGACFYHVQTTHGLKLLATEARFMERVACAAFPEILSPKQAKGKADPPAPFICSGNHPKAVVMRRMEKEVLQDLGAASPVDVRIEALLQLLDVLLRVPISFPRDFFRPMKRECAALSIMSENATTCDGETVVECSPAISFSISVAGKIPPCYCQSGPNRAVVLWLTVSADDTADKDDDSGGDEAMYIELPDFSTVSPVLTPLLPEGGFFVEVVVPPFPCEGYYLFDVKLGLRGSVWQEWAIPTNGSSSQTKIAVKR